MKDCRACGKQVSDQARRCVYCEADVETGERPDVESIVREHFAPADQKKRKWISLGPAESQAVFIAAVVVVLVVAVLGLHRWAVARNESDVADTPPVPLTEIADLSGRESENEELPLPDLEFEYDGNGARFASFVSEPVPPGPAPATETAAANDGESEGAAPAEDAQRPPEASEPNSTTTENP